MKNLVCLGKIIIILFAYNKFITYLYRTKEPNKKGGVYVSNYRNGLIFKIFNLLALIETPKNQSIIRQIEGLLNALIEED